MEQPRFETKIVVAVAEDLATWQKLNVTAFLCSGITAAYPELVGEPYCDADGATYHPLFRQPVTVLAGTRAALARARARAQERDLVLAIYTEGMFRTGHDTANRAVVATLSSLQLDLVGLAACGDRRSVDRSVEGLALHP